MTQIEDDGTEKLERPLSGWELREYRTEIRDPIKEILQAQEFKRQLKAIAYSSGKWFIGFIVALWGYREAYPIVAPVIVRIFKAAIGP